MSGEEVKEKEAARAHKEDRVDRYYEILEQQKNSSQNKRDAVLVSVSTVAAGFCATKAEAFIPGLFGWVYLGVALFFIATVYAVVLSYNKAERDINKMQKELGAEYEPKLFYNDLAFVLFTIALVGVCFAFVGYYIFPPEK